MTIEAASLLKEIQSAFASVKLEDCIGLYEAGAIDDYANDSIRLAARINDEKDSWDSIPDETIAQ